MLQIIVPLFVAIVGLIMHLIASNPNIKEIGKWMFICGLFWSVSPFVSQTVNIIGK